MCKKSVELAKEVVNSVDKKVYIAGSIGPTSKSLSLPNGKNPLGSDKDLLVGPMNQYCDFFYLQS